jgi:hypothetical protein
VSTCLHIGWGRNWTVWEYRWRLRVEMWHSLCAAMYLIVGFFEVMLVLLVVMNCAELMWELNCLVYIKSEVHVILFLLCIWCQYCYAILSSSCVCVFCNWSLKMIDVNGLGLWNRGEVLLIQIGISASYVQGRVYLLLWVYQFYNIPPFSPFYFPLMFSYLNFDFTI